ncbi:MAG: DegT/DnrJ/EryC1/StrS family aminotransferase, partial [Candidatus Omnitrophica bacterium]|nr:DegT/DnrJ/EryC1/StrS family aminotransferase [Candidatus Omnitrophota bacterium]
GAYRYPCYAGITAFYLILEALQRRSHRTHVILPAYTAGSLVVAVRKAGLIPVLCDVSLRDFNMDTQSLAARISVDTLAVVAVHMFGLPMRDIVSLRTQLKAETMLIEDCCQSMGSRINDFPTGSFGDISFTSFNRGKNFTTFGGGCITTDSAEHARNLEEVLAALEPAAQQRLRLAFEIAAYRLGTNPWTYAALQPLVSRYKEIAPPKDFSATQLSGCRAFLGSRLLPRADQLFLARYNNGRFLINGLRDTAGVILPEIPANVFCVFNRLPILFEDAVRLASVQSDLWKAGFETSRMYVQPLHRMFDVGYNKEDFPNAMYVADHLLALSVYPGLSSSDLERIVAVIKKQVRGS